MAQHTIIVLSNIESDRSSTDLARKVVRHKPEGLTDGCYTESGFVADDMTNVDDFTPTE